MLVDATPKGMASNSNVTIAEAGTYFRTHRMNASAWDAAPTRLPDADGYLVNNGGGYSIGAVAAAVDAGVGTFAVGTEFSFSGHATVYQVSVALAGPGTLQFAPALTSAVSDNEAIARLTANPREEAIIAASRFLDQAMNWGGTKRTTEQRMRHPRYGLTNRDLDTIDEDAICEILREGTCEMALALLQKDRQAEPPLAGLGLDSAKVGTISVKISKGSTKQTVPQNVAVILEPIGVPKDIAQGSVSMVRVLRS